MFKETLGVLFGYLLVMTAVYTERGVPRLRTWLLIGGLYFGTIFLVRWHYLGHLL